MDYKMIVLDIDGTLLRDDHTISKGTKEVLITAQKNGVKLVLASGRTPFAMWDLAEELDLIKNGNFILSDNGAKITNCKTREVIFDCSLSIDRVHQLFDISQREGVKMITYLEDCIIANGTNQYIELDAKITKMKLVITDAFKLMVTVPVAKVMMVEEPEKLAPIENKLQKEFAGTINVACSNPYFLEFTEKGIDKGRTLKTLIDQLGIKQEEVIAIGDGNNDLSMIEFAGLGVAMGNATERVKSVADYITDSNMEDGVAKVVKKFVLYV